MSFAVGAAHAKVRRGGYGRSLSAYSGVGETVAGPGPVDPLLFEPHSHCETVGDEIVVEVRFGRVEAVEPCRRR